jgi:hypothetical protein
MLPKIPFGLVPSKNARAETFPDRYDFADAHKRERSQMGTVVRITNTTQTDAMN